MPLVEYAVAHIELNRPEAATAFDLDTTHELSAAVARAGGAAEFARCC